jgi:hypothetical protein
MFNGRTAALVLWLALAVPAAAQPVYSPSRTPDGHPDFQGVWGTRWTTPLERMPDFKTLVIAPEQGAALHRGILARLDSGDPLGTTYSWDFTGPLMIRGDARSSVLVDPPDGKLPYTEEGRARRKAFAPYTGDEGPESRALNERCLMAGSGYAPFLAIPAGNIRQIVQTRDSVVIHTETFNQLRLIPLDGRSGPVIPRGGSSIGHWDGETLVVETSGYLETDRFRIAPLSTFAISPKTKIIERFRMIGPDEILYRFTVEDPTLYARAWTGETLMKRTGDRMFEFACHEGNYGLAGILAGARETERRALAARAKRGSP